MQFPSYQHNSDVGTYATTSQMPYSRSKSERLYNLPLHERLNSGDLCDARSPLRERDRAQQLQQVSEDASDFPPENHGERAQLFDNAGFVVKHVLDNKHRKLQSFWQHDYFHALLSLHWWQLSLFTAALCVGWAMVLSAGMWLVTLGDAFNCLGYAENGVLDYYFFVMETMFTIGFGSPRYPACYAADWWVTVIVVTGLMVESICAGLVFAKLAGQTTKKWDIRFSTRICAKWLSSNNSGNSEAGDVELPSSGPNADQFMSYSLRVINRSKDQMLKPWMQILLVEHRKEGNPVVREYETDVIAGVHLPNFPLTVNFHNGELDGNALHLSWTDPPNTNFEFHVKICFTDSRTSKFVQVVERYSMNQVELGCAFENIVEQQKDLSYAVHMSRFDDIIKLVGESFVKDQSSRQACIYPKCTINSSVMCGGCGPLFGADLSQQTDRRNILLHPELSGVLPPAS